MTTNQFTPRAAAKAYLATIGSVAGFFIGVLDPTATGLTAFTTITTVQWLAAVTVALGSFGITWSVPNQTPRF